MTGLARHSTRVLLRLHLRKSPGPCSTLRVATDAEYSRIRQGWQWNGLITIRHRLGMFCQRTVTGLAIDLRMLAILLLIKNIGVTRLAGLMTSKMNGMGGDFADGCSPVMAVLPKCLGNSKMPDYQKAKRTNNK